MNDNSTTSPPPYNLTGVNFHDVPKRAVTGSVIDVHTHTQKPHLTAEFLRAADAYGIGRIFTMAPLEDVDPLRAAFPGRFEFIAIPRWQDAPSREDFFRIWHKRIDSFYEKGSRIIKFHMAPGSQKRFGATLDSPEVQEIIEHAYNLGYHFMSHVGDPKAWFGENAKYKPSEGHKAFHEQFAMLDRMLEKYPDRIHMGAHMGGSLEDLDALSRRLDRFPHYIVDSSATKWMVRAVAEQPLEPLRDFFIRYANRILFGSDLVVNEKFNYEHYLSRYWVHLKLWESNFDGLSPIEDPDAKDGRPTLRGLHLPPDVLEKMYRTNALEWLGAKVLKQPLE